METCELEKILNDISDLKYTTECSNTIFSGCEVAMHYNRDGRWTVWLTDSIDAVDGFYHAAGAYRYVDGELGEDVLEVSECDCDKFCGDNAFSTCGKTLEEAVNKLAAKVAILRQNPDYILVFPGEEIMPQEFLSEEEYLDLKNEVEKDYELWRSMKEQKKS
ncbi:MAG: hypothetical protein E7042_01695 [Lentisphaerae bacterium]|nr:hypothetical protein [Lentisphaerota bacterium]